MRFDGRVVVTGGSGFLGSHVCERLLSQGCEVLCVDNFCTGTERNIRHLTDDPAFHLLEGDVTDGLEVDGTVSAVLHLASPASPPDYLRLPLETMRAGSVGTQNALDLTRRKGARFLLASTSEVYGDPQVHPQPETYWGHVNPVGPRAVYDEAKRFSEAMTVAYRDTWGVDCRIVRIFNTFGPRMRADDGRMIPSFICQAIAGAPLKVAGDGSQTRSISYVSDTVDGILRLLASDSERGPVNIGGQDEMTVLATAELIRGLVGSSSPIEFVPRPQDDPTIRKPDIRKAVSALGWQPGTDLESELKKTIDWFLDHGPATGH
ncbi:SDR family oxidoreductase [Streptomyces sp. NBS 14/10]|uniref:UDP-glucuronic acid decarboxylase family protein n=1 Tax=Streptomyces sp. NBS 14/10 TaxID=1945643 RepID=UPI000B7E63A6|nr:UDP-glucuronic acid decarboxylase family protein [Streptomyces sp. NBS 14/10]KAK1184388.1 SDR family oxidoreductase [Streptomyces sp. NBS 14/10]